MKEQQQNPAFNFFKQGTKKTLFEILTGSINFPQRPFTQQDLNVDLVIRMKVPEQEYCHKSKEILIDSFLKNCDPQFVSVYNMALEYITYLTESQGIVDKENQLMLRLMVSLDKIKNEKNKSYYDQQLDKINFVTNCFEEFNGEIDLFTLFYNTVIYVLQKKCGFKVRSFIAHSKNKKTEKIQRVIYLLLSQSDQNLLIVSTKIRMKKKIDMTDIDFHLNAPTDRKGRPIKYNSQLQTLQQNEIGKSRNQLKQQLDYKVKGPSRWLNIKHNNLKKIITQEAQISRAQIEKYRLYLQEYIGEIERIINEEQSIQMNVQEKRYLFRLNRGKLNEGCLIRFYKKKIRKRIFEMTLELNKKYGYQSLVYDDSYFEFRLPSKKKAFFDKLDHLLRYEPTVASPSGQLALFSKMERIKMAYFTLGQFFKVHSFGSFGMELFTLHDDYERYGDIDSKNNSQNENQNKKQQFSPIPLNQSWNAFIPMVTSIGKLRHYMGENYTLQAMAKIALITYFLIIAPISVITEFLKSYIFSDQTDVYKFSFIQLGIIVICLTLFIEGWKVKQNKFFRNYAQQYNQKQYRDQYTGPFARNYVTDQPNQYMHIQSNATRFIRIWKALIGILVLFSLLILQGIFFWQMRLEIVRLFTNFPSISFQYLSISHVIFYGVYFIGNQLFYNFIFKKISTFLVKWQNYPTNQEQQNKNNYYKYFFTFGVQFMGPIFLYLIQPFQGVSCYAAQCFEQFQLYTYSRYFLVFLMVFFKYFKFLFRFCRGQFINIIKKRKEQSQQDTFQEKLQKLLTDIDQQYKKQDVQTDLREEALAMFYYVVFTIHFPFCSIFTLALLYVNYIFDRIEIFKNKRRPIPSFGKITKFSEIFSIILHVSIIFNCWAICFTFQFLEYDLKNIIQIFVLTVTQDNVLTLKLMVSVVLFIIYQFISFILKKFISGFDFSSLDLRKKAMYKKYLFSFFERLPIKKIQQILPIRSIMRTFSYQFVTEQKKNKWKFFQSFKKRSEISKNKLTMMQFKLITEDSLKIEQHGQQSLSKLKQ